jgi:hypothetical protein
MNKKDQPWFSSPIAGIISMILLAIMDLGGFIQGTLSAYPDFDVESLSVQLSMLVMLLGFVAAFEGSTLYMGYAFSLKLYHYDRYAIKRINTAKDKDGTQEIKFSSLVSTDALGWISFSAFMLGVVGNVILRIGILKAISTPNSRDKAVALVMMILPVITSILNFVIS